MERQAVTVNYTEQATTVRFESAGSESSGFSTPFEMNMKFDDMPVRGSEMTLSS